MKRLQQYKSAFYFVMRLVTGAILSVVLTALSLAMYLFLKFSPFEVMCGMGAFLVICLIGYVIAASVWQIKGKETDETN